MAFDWPQESVAAVSFAFDGDRAGCLELRGRLAQVGCPATFYVDAPTLLADVAGWKEALAAGHELGNHALWTATDSDGLLPHLSMEAIEEEIDELRHLLAQTFGQPDHSAAMPLLKTLPDASGLPVVPDVVRRTVARLNEASLGPVLRSRYRCVRGSEGRFFSSNSRLDDIPTCRIDGMDAVAMGLVAQVAISQGAWVVLSATDPDPDAVVQVARYLRRQPIWVAPVWAVAEHIRESNGVPGAFESV